MKKSMWFGLALSTSSLALSSFAKSVWTDTVVIFLAFILIHNVGMASHPLARGRTRFWRSVVLLASDISGLSMVCATQRTC